VLSTTSLGLAPCEAGRSSPNLGARRFSQPLSGLCNPKFCGLVSCRSHPDTFPLKRSPHRNRAPLSRPHAPLWLSTAVPEHAIRHLVTAAFPDARARARLPGSRDDYELPFGAPKRSSRLLWVPNCEPSGFVGFTHFEALILPRVRSHRTRLPRTEGRYSSGLSCPSEAFASHASDSQTRARSRIPNHSTTPEGTASRSGEPLLQPWPEGFQPATWLRSAHLGPKASS